ncbi:MAG: hypothetical protein LBO73_04295 [Holosporaceae bacterium]|nr:hypothetical protein [Holosporaceae bacterium]
MIKMLRTIVFCCMALCSVTQGMEPSSVPNPDNLIAAIEALGINIENYLPYPGYSKQDLIRRAQQPVAIARVEGQSDIVDLINKKEVLAISQFLYAVCDCIRLETIRAQAEIIRAQKFHLRIREIFLNLLVTDIKYEDKIPPSERDWNMKSLEGLRALIQKLPGGDAQNSFEFMNDKELTARLGKMCKIASGEWALKTAEAYQKGENALPDGKESSIKIFYGRTPDDDTRAYRFLSRINETLGSVLANVIFYGEREIENGNIVYVSRPQYIAIREAAARTLNGSRSKASAAEFLRDPEAARWTSWEEIAGLNAVTGYLNKVLSDFRNGENNPEGPAAVPTIVVDAPDRSAEIKMQLGTEHEKGIRICLNEIYFVLQNCKLDQELSKSLENIKRMYRQLKACKSGLPEAQQIRTELRTAVSKLPQFPGEASLIKNNVTSMDIGRAKAHYAAWKKILAVVLKKLDNINWSMAKDAEILKLMSSTNAQWPTDKYLFKDQTYRVTLSALPAGLSEAEVLCPPYAKIYFNSKGGLCTQDLKVEGEGLTGSSSSSSLNTDMSAASEDSDLFGGPAVLRGKKIGSSASSAASTPRNPAASIVRNPVAPIVRNPAAPIVRNSVAPTR